MGNSGIRAEGIRYVALLRKDNYRAWSSKLKAQLKVMDCWRLIIGVVLMPPATAQVQPMRNELRSLRPRLSLEDRLGPPNTPLPRKGGRSNNSGAKGVNPKSMSSLREVTAESATAGIASGSSRQVLVWREIFCDCAGEKRCLPTRGQPPRVYHVRHGSLISNRASLIIWQNIE